MNETADLKLIPARKNAGMSLIELLIAVTIATICITSVLMLMTQALRNLRHLEIQLQMTQQARLTLARMTREISSAHHPYGMFGNIPWRQTTNNYLPWLQIRTAAAGYATTYPVAAGAAGEEMSFVASLYQEVEMEPDSLGVNGDLSEVHYYLNGAATPTSPRHLYRRKDWGMLGTHVGLGSPGPNLIGAWTSTASAIAPQAMAFYVQDLQFDVWDRTGTLVAASPYVYPVSTASAPTDFPSRIRIHLKLYDSSNPQVVPPQEFVTDVGVMRNNN